MDHEQCPFCSLAQSRFLLESDVALALLDAFPISEGHTLVIPKRHVVSVFDLPKDEQAALWSLVTLVRSKLLDDLTPDGFNIGINDGMAAGQTVMHAHIHVIPRRKGDVTEPRGGVRWIIANKAPYWAEDAK